MLNFISLPLCKNSTSIPKFFSFKKKSALLEFNDKRFFNKPKKLKCCSEEIKNILLELPEAFVHDEKRPSLLSLAVLQRLGKLGLLEKKIHYSTITKN